MAAKLLTVVSAEGDENGVYLEPPIPMAVLTGDPAFARLQSGSPLELRRPDGTALRTHLLRYGARVTRGGDGNYYVPGGPSGPEWVIGFTLPAGRSPADVPPGTEVWVVPPSEEGEAWS